MPRWSAIPILCLPVSTVVLAALLLGPAPARAYATGAADPPPVTDSPDPGASPPPPPSESATPVPTDSTPPPPDSPTPGQPTPSPTTVGSGSHGHHPVLKVTVFASNAVLGPGYWRGQLGTSFTVTVRNTGTVAASVRIDYTVPAGVSDAATGACGHGQCAVPAVEPGTVAVLPIAVTVAPDAWRQAPLAGRFTVSARAPRARVATGQGTWGVVFPPGPPAPGIDLQVDDVTPGDRTGAPGPLRIRLTNTSAVPAAARLDIVVPPGVDAGPLPPGCSRQPEPATVGCALGTAPPGQQRSVEVALAVAGTARAGTPLTGLVRATLTAADRQVRTAQASYQILVPATLSGVTAASVVASGVTASGPASTAPPAAAEGGRTPVLDARSRLAWPVIAGSSVVLVVVIVGLALGLRRPGKGARPAQGARAAQGARPGQGAGPGKGVPAGAPGGAVALAPASGRPNRRYGGLPWGSGTGPAAGLRPSSEVRLEWVEVPDPVAPAGSPVAGKPPEPVGSAPEPSEDQPGLFEGPGSSEGPGPSEDRPDSFADAPESGERAPDAVSLTPGSPPEMASELAEVAAELAEVAAILGGPGPARSGRPA